MADFEDDLDDDVRAAFAEVSGRTEPAAPAPTREARQPDADAGDQGDQGGKQTDDGEQRGQSRTPPKDERGRFAKRGEAEQKGDQGKQTQARTQQQGDGGEEESDDGEEGQGEKKSSPSPAGGPPSSWSVKSKAAWDQLPAEVRADIAKREGEVAQGFAALRDYKDLKPYADMARQQNTTIAAALKNYVGIENMLKQDMSAGLQQIAKNFGLSQQQAAQMFAGIAHKLMGGAQPAPQTRQQGQQGANAPQPGDPLYNILKPFIEPLQQELASLKQTHTSREEADRNASQQSLARAIETFSQQPENRYFNELEETISRLFETGMVPLTGNHEGDLRTAYDMAANMVPDVREALIEQRLREQQASQRQREQEAADRARRASRSITGPRVPGTVVQKQREPARNGFDDIEDDVRAAFAFHSQR